MLFTKYGNDCGKFLANEVAAAAALPTILAAFPDLKAGSSGALDTQQLALLGVLSYVDTLGACASEPQGFEAVEWLRTSTSAWRASAGRDDALEIAKGFAQARNYSETWPGISVAGDACLERQGALMFAVAAAAALEPLSTVPPKTAVPQENWLNNYDWDGDGVVEGAGEDGASNGQADRSAPAVAAEPGGSQENSVEASPSSDQSANDTYTDVGEFTWEPGDPGTNRGNDDMPIDLTSHVSPADVAGIRPYSGWWSPSSCGEDDLYTIGHHPPPLTLAVACRVSLARSSRAKRGDGQLPAISQTSRQYAAVTTAAGRATDRLGGYPIPRSNCSYSMNQSRSDSNCAKRLRNRWEGQTGSRESQSNYPATSAAPDACQAA